MTGRSNIGSVRGELTQEVAGEVTGNYREVTQEVSGELPEEMKEGSD
jgi:hypothetical protein